MSQRSCFPVLAIALLLLGEANAQTAGGVTAGSSSIRLLRSIAGTKGSEQAGRYVIEDPKTEFHIPGDKQVTVYFEWEGALGPHHFEANWKNPEGKIIGVSDFQYVAKDRRFGAYWNLLLTESTSPGIWTIEARVDGELAGTHAFQIVAAPGIGPVDAAARLLNPSEIYQKAQAATVYVEKLGAQRQKLAIGSGFFVSPDRLVTAFEVVDGASLAHVRFPDGREADASEVIAWNRWQDWVVLKVRAASTPTLATAKNEVPSVGDRVFYLDTSGDGNRTIADASVIGMQNSPKTSDRLNVSYQYRLPAVGSPVLDEHGEVIGMLGGVAYPGAWSTRNPRVYAGSFVFLDTMSVASSAIPISLVSTAAEATPVTFENLVSLGQFIRPLVENRNLVRGAISRYLERARNYVAPTDERSEYSRREKQAFVHVRWEGKEKRNGVVYFRVYDLENRLLSESKSGKLSLRQGTTTFTSWELDISAWPLGTYRIDVMLDNDPVWRAFIRVTE